TQVPVRNHIFGAEALCLRHRGAGKACPADGTGNIINFGRLNNGNDKFHELFPEDNNSTWKEYSISVFMYTDTSMPGLRGRLYLPAGRRPRSSLGLAEERKRFVFGHTHILFGADFPIAPVRSTQNIDH